jgi:hypothetical protein
VSNPGNRPDSPLNTVWHLNCNGLGIWLLLKVSESNSEPGESELKSSRRRA